MTTWWTQVEHAVLFRDHSVLDFRIMSPTPAIETNGIRSGRDFGRS